MIRTAVVAAALVAGLAASARAQAARCDFPNTPQTRTYGTRLPSGQYNYFQGGGVRVVCASKGITIRAAAISCRWRWNRCRCLGRGDAKGAWTR